MVIDRPDQQVTPPQATGIVLTPAQLKSRRLRNVAIGLLVGLLVVLVYVMTIAKLGGAGVSNRAI